jgi:hypothetical protein
LPSCRRSSRASGGRSTSSTSSARSKTASGIVSRTRTQVICATMSLSDSRCCTLSVVCTSMPASSSSSTSCQRFGWREPGALVCASSSTSSSPGRRFSAASRSNSCELTPRCSSGRSGSASQTLEQRGGLVATVGLDDAQHHVEALGLGPPRRLEHAKVLPTPGAAPKKILSCPRALSARAATSSSASGSGRASSSALRIEVLVEPEHVDAGFAEDAESARQGVELDLREHRSVVQPRAAATRGGLEAGRLGADVRVEPGARRGREVDWDRQRRVAVGGPQRRDPPRDPLAQIRVRGPQVAARRRRRVVRPRRRQRPAASISLMPTNGTTRPPSP